MRRVILMRHAKSSWDDPALDDFDRPLNKRGLRDAPEMGRRVALDFDVDRIVSSTAARARATAEAVADVLGLDASQLAWSGTLYLSSPATQLQALREQPAEAETVMLVAHNPGVSNCASRLAGEDLGDLPTAAVVVIEFDVDAWDQLGFGAGRLVAVDTPKG